MLTQLNRPLPFQDRGGVLSIKADKMVSINKILLHTFWLVSQNMN